jgi:hypothetical protein
MSGQIELQQAWLQHLIHWLQAAGYEKKKEWAEQLRIPVRTLSSWQQAEASPNELSLQRVLAGLYFLRDEYSGEHHRPAADEILDWLALLGQTSEQILDWVDDQQIRDWLQSGLADQVPWPNPTLPSAYVEREITNQLVTTLTGLKAYRRPVCRVLVLYGATGSGKTTLAAAVMRSRVVQGHFRSGGLWLTEQNLQRGVEPEQIGTEASPPRWWRQWLKAEATVGLLIVDDVTHSPAIDLLLRDLGTQIRLVITTQDQDTVRPSISGRLSSNEVLCLSIDKLTRPEGEQLVTYQTGKTVSAQERRYLAWVIREIGYPGPLHLLADEAQTVGWSQVWQWLQQEPEQETPLTSHWESLLRRAWQRLQIIEQIWLIRLVQGLPRGGSFGQAYAAIVWGETPDVAYNRLQILTRRGWLEVIDEVESGTPPQIAAALGRQRYRLLRPGLTFIRQQYGLRGRHWAWRRWLWGQRVNFRFQKVIKPSLAMSLASWIIIPGILLRIPINAGLWLLGRDYHQWDQNWAGGRLLNLLVTCWEEQGQEIPAEIWLTHQTREIIYGQFGILLILMVTLIYQLTLTQMPLLLTSTIGIFLLIFVMWLVKAWLGWQLALLSLYSEHRPREVELAQQLLLIFTDRKRSK